MARQLNVVAKHSVEKTALNVDCFTTVSDITAQECACFCKDIPISLPNGFEKDLFRKAMLTNNHEKKPVKNLLKLPKHCWGTPFTKMPYWLPPADDMNTKTRDWCFYRCHQQPSENAPIVKRRHCFYHGYDWIKGQKSGNLIEKMKNGGKEHSKSAVKSCPYVTHELVGFEHDSIMSQLRRLGFCNSENEQRENHLRSRLISMGTTASSICLTTTCLSAWILPVFPSYYRHVGLYPHESLAFSVPTITCFSGRLWNMGEKNGWSSGIVGYSLLTHN